MKPGVPKGALKGRTPANKKTYNPEELLDAIAKRAVGGPAPKEITYKDREMLKRISGMTVEQFNEHLSAKLRQIADELADEILARKSEIGANNLAFTLAVAADKLARLDGTSKLAGASVNVQVNNYGSVDRETLIAQLTGRKPILPAQPPTTPPQSDSPPTPTQDLDHFDTSPPIEQESQGEPSNEQA